MAVVTAVPTSPWHTGPGCARLQGHRMEPPSALSILSLLPKENPWKSPFLTAKLD